MSAKAGAFLHTSIMNSSSIRCIRSEQHRPRAAPLQQQNRRHPLLLRGRRGPLLGSDAAGLVSEQRRVSGSRAELERRLVVCADSTMAAGAAPLPDDDPSSSGRPAAAKKPGKARGKAGDDVLGERRRPRPRSCRARQLYNCCPTLSLLSAPSHPPPHHSSPLPPKIKATVDLLEQMSGSTALSYLDKFKAPRWLFKTVACLVLGGQVFARMFKGKIHLRNTRDQLQLVGPKSLGVALLTAGFVGMVFTIQVRGALGLGDVKQGWWRWAQRSGPGYVDTQSVESLPLQTTHWQFVREFAKLGLTRSVGGVLALALARELTPVVTSIILAGRVGSAFAAELGTMQVSEQVDSLRVLSTDPVDYLVTPRVLASMVAGPILNVLCFCMGGWFGGERRGEV
jgi:ABC-type transporter Mla maintaining outer membrane lipid asymmetry permease subunit MlaE